MAHTERAYLPATGRDVFLPLYDPITKLFGFDAARDALLEQAELRPHHRVLDVGCGTGTLAVRIKRLHPTVEVVALDPDPRALTRALRKAVRAGVAIRLDRGFSDLLSYGSDTFDRVFSSMMFHHLDADAKEPTLREIRRVLKPGGRLELLDFAGPGSSVHGWIGRMVHAHRRLSDNDEWRVLDLMARAGFAEVSSIGQKGGLVGRVAFYQARK